MRLPLLILLLLWVLISCNPEAHDETGEGATIAGSWQLFERGYSPGDRYIVEEVPATPQQLIHFNADSTFESNMDEYKSFNRFRVLQENGTLVLVLSTTLGTDGDDDRSFTMTLSGQRLELRTRWCIEGCHEAYRPVKWADRDS
jgi:hypothetical protein